MKLRTRYLSGADPGPTEVDAYESQLHGLAERRDAEIRAIRDGASRQNAADERQVAERLRRDGGKPSEDAIATAWRDRVLPRLEAGFALDEILEAPGLSRSEPRRDAFLVPPERLRACR